MQRPVVNLYRGGGFGRGRRGPHRVLRYFEQIAHKNGAEDGEDGQEERGQNSRSGNGRKGAADPERLPRSQEQHRLSRAVLKRGGEGLE